MDRNNGPAWYKIADNIAELPFSKDGLAEATVNGRLICLTFFKEKLYACAGKCPHAGGHLAAGYVDATGNIVCPEHCYKFNLENGRNISGEGYYLKTYKTKVSDEGVFIDMGIT